MPQEREKKQVATANRLTDGIVVFLHETGDWVERIEEAAVACDEEERAVLEAKAVRALATQEIAGWEFAEVTGEPGDLRAVKNLHRIRSLGPTVRRDLGKQAELYG